MTTRKTVSRRSLTEKSIASKERMASDASPTTARVGSGGDSPSDFWDLDTLVAWKRKHHYPLPDKRLLEPGWAGELDREELAFVWGHIQKSLSLAHDWGIRNRQLTRSNIPVGHLRAVAMMGL